MEVPKAKVESALAKVRSVARLLLGVANHHCCLRSLMSPTQSTPPARVTLLTLAYSSTTSHHPTTSHHTVVPWKQANRVQAGEALVYEGRWKTYYFLVEARSESKNRTVQGIRQAFKEADGMLYDQPGHVRWMFRHQGVVECVAPLLHQDLQRMQEEVERIQQRVVRGSGGAGQTTGDDDTSPPVLKPSSIPDDALLELGLDVGAEDMHLLHIPVQDVLTRNNSQLPNHIYHAFQDPRLQMHLPVIQGLQMVCPFSILAHVGQHFERFQHAGYRPWVRRISHMYIPSLDELESDATWKELPNDEDERWTLLQLIEKLKEHEDVTDVWHNIRGHDPWNELEVFHHRRGD